MSLTAGWVSVLVAIPGLVAAITLLPRKLEQLRLLTIAGAGAMLAWSALPLVVDSLVGWEMRPWGPWLALGDAAVLRMDALSRPLPALTAALWLLTVTVTPRTRLDRGGIRRTGIATLFTTLAFLSESPGLLVVTWGASVLVFQFALPPTAGRARKIVLAYLGASTLAFAVGALLVFGPETIGPRVRTIGLWLIVAAAVARKGIFPFHAWLPAVFDHGRVGPAVLFSTPQLGTYVVAVLVLPLASPELLTTLAVLALATAVYGAALTLVQRSARRACGYLFISQSALVMAGLDTTSEEALAGALILWLSSSLAFAGLARCLLVLEARHGRLDLSKYHGAYPSSPMLAATFLLLGLTCTGFPGTLGFVGEELLLAGAVQAFPALGFLVVIAGALTGLAILRMYFSLFCGRREDSIPLELGRREAGGLAAVVGFLLLMGIAPGSLVESRLEASFELLAAGGRPPSSRITPKEVPTANRQRELHRIKHVFEHAERIANINTAYPYFGVARDSFCGPGAGRARGASGPSPTALRGRAGDRGNVRRRSALLPPWAAARGVDPREATAAGVSDAAEPAIRRTPRHRFHSRIPVPLRASYRSAWARPPSATWAPPMWASPGTAHACWGGS